MSDDYSMGAALDLAGKYRELSESVNQSVEKAGNDVKGRVGNHSQKQAAWINRDKAKIDAAKAGIEMRSAATERNFSLLKKGLTVVASIAGGAIAQYSENASRGQRADVAVQNGAAGKRRLGAGGEHEKGLTDTFDFQAAKTKLDGDLANVRGDMEGLKQKHAGGESWSVADQQSYADLRKQEQTMEKMAGQLSVLTSFRPNLGAIADVQVPGKENKNGNDTSFHANADAYLKQVGMNDSQVQAFKEYDRLQGQMSGVGDTKGERIKSDGFRDAGAARGLSGDALDNQVAKDMHNWRTNNGGVGSQLQNRLDEVMADQHAVKKMGPAAAYVKAQGELEALEKSPNSSPSDIGAKRAEVNKAEVAFGSSEDRAFWKGPLGQMLGELLQEVIGTSEDSRTGRRSNNLQALSQQYAAAQIALSQASDQAGQASKAAMDMELS